MTAKLPPITKVCQNPECGKEYVCDKRWGKKRREANVTCSVPCQRKWLGIHQTGKKRSVWNTKINLKPKAPAVPKPKKEKKVEEPPKKRTTLEEFKEALSRTAKRRKEWYKNN